MLDHHLNHRCRKTVLLHESADMENSRGRAVKFEEASSELISQARSGNHAAFEQIYRIHVGRVHGLCLRIVADRSTAEELTQQIFIRLWMKLGSFRGESSFSSWLHRLAVNAALNELKASSMLRRQSSAPEDLLVEMPSDQGPSPETQLDLESAIASLPAQARIIFVLHEIEGLRHDEIAEELGLAAGTCKAQLSRARKLLREALRRP